jgi:hypothetical protein
MIPDEDLHRRAAETLDRADALLAVTRSAAASDMRRL